MPVSEPLFEGIRYSIRAWLDEREQVSVTQEFIMGLIATNNSDASSLINLLERTASHGPPQNEQKFRYLDGIGEGLIEFKARGGSRILGFIDAERRRIICTHGIPKLKPKRLNREMKAAQEIKRTYLFENASVENGHVQ